MFKEIMNVRQEPHGFRRWFEGDGLELIVWYNDDRAFDGFQLLYVHGGHDCSLTWKPAGGFTHCKVDEGDGNPFKNLTPVLCAAGPIPWQKVENLFALRSQSLEPVLRDIIDTRIKRRN